MVKKIKEWWELKMISRDISNAWKEPPKRRERVTHFGYDTFIEGYNSICRKYKKGNHVSMEMKKVNCKKCIRAIVDKKKRTGFLFEAKFALMRQ